MGVIPESLLGLVLANTDNMSTPDWLAFRKLGIGGSDAGALVGVDDYKSRRELWDEKRLDDYPQVEENEAMYWGKRHEPTLAEEFGTQHNFEVMEFKAILQHPEHAHMLANVDRIIYHPAAGYGVLEIKTASEYVKQDWADDAIPPKYYCQVQHYLAVTGLTYAYIAVLIGGNKFETRYIARNEEFIQTLIQLEKDFWETNVIGEVEPEVDASESCKRALGFEFREVEHIEIELSDEAVFWAQQHHDADAAIKMETERKKLADNMLMSMLGTAEIGLVNGEKFVTWKANKNGVRTLRVVGGKNDGNDLREAGESNVDGLQGA